MQQLLCLVLFCCSFSAFSLRLSSQRDHVRSVSSAFAVSSSDAQKKTVRWGIIGLGDVTQVKSEPPFWKCDGSVLTAVMRRTPGKAAEWAERVPLELNNNEQCTGYDNIEEFLQHPGLDAVYIATRPGSHLELCQEVAAAQAEIKAVHVEKPVGRCAAETQAMKDAMTDGELYTAYINRAFPRTQAVRKLLQEGAVGDRVTAVMYKLVGTGGARDISDEDGLIPWRLDATQSGGGLIMDVGCHLIDRIDWLCGPILNVEGIAENRGSPRIDVEDYVSFQGTIGVSDWAAVPSEGATVSCTWDFSGTLGTEETDALEIVGPKGSLRMPAMSASLPVQVLDGNGNIARELEFGTPKHTAQPMIQAITDELRGRGSAPFISRADNAIRSSQVLDKALIGYYGNRNPGYWERPESWPGCQSK